MSANVETFGSIDPGTWEPTHNNSDGYPTEEPMPEPTTESTQEE